jgi:hypothetical protein
MNPSIVKVTTSVFAAVVLYSKPPCVRIFLVGNGFALLHKDITDETELISEYKKVHSEIYARLLVQFILSNIYT